MRIQETKLYTFDELSDDAKQKAVEKLYDINVDYEWWDSTYEDAEMIGLKISEFDLDRASYVKGDFMWDCLAVAKEIIKEHGDNCETYTTAKQYLTDYNSLIAAQCQEEADFLCMPLRDEIDFEEMHRWIEEIETDDIDDKFLKSLCEDYRIILQHEYDYLTSEEAIIETIEANEYYFDINGNLA